jgi:hypothetical protein
MGTAFSLSQNDSMKKPRRKVGKKDERPTPDKKEPMPNPQHKRDFEQLLDDSIFGVKKK